GDDGARVVRVGEAMKMRSKRAEETAQLADIAMRQVADRADIVTIQALQRHAPDTPEPLDGQGPEEFRQVLRSQHQQTVGLGHVAENLRDHLGARYADRYYQAGFVEHAAPQLRRRVLSGSEQPLGACQVDESLIER